MAKQLVNPVERHVEKAILGAAVLLFLGVAARYMVTSPNHIELGNDRVTPGNIDRKLLETATMVREGIRREKADEETPTPLFAQFKQQLDPFTTQKLKHTLPSVVRFGPPVPVIDPPESGFGGADLVKVMPLIEDPAPKLISGRSTFVVETEQGDRFVASNWVTVTALFDIKAQIAELRSKYGASRTEVILAPPELQRRTRNPDGTWPDTWETISPWYVGGRLPYPPVPVIRLVEEDGTKSLSRSSLSALDQFANAIREPQTRVDAIRPLMPEIRNGTPWTLPVFTNRRSVLMQDDYYVFPHEPPAAEPLDRYPDADGELREQKEVISKEQQIANDLAEAKSLLASALKNDSTNDATLAFNLAQAIEKDPAASASDKSRAKQIKTDADIAIQTIERKILTSGSKNIGQGGEPREFKRDPLPIQQVWALDIRPDSVRSGKTYQYRLRPVLYNLLAGQLEKMHDPNDALKVLLYGPWTKPIEVTIEDDAVFFVAGEDERNHMVNLEFYRWFEGDWVKTSRRVKLGVGDRMQARQLTTVRDINDPNSAAKAPVDFGADATILDIDFDRIYRDRKRGSGRDGIRFGDPRPGVALVYVDNEGRLHERFVQKDKANPERKERKSKLYSPPKQTN